MVSPCLADANEAEGPARRSADREVADHETVVQVPVLQTRVNDLPRAAAGRSMPVSVPESSSALIVR